MSGSFETKSTRRELIAGLLGAAAAAGCRRKQPVVGWDGGFVDEVMTDGHRLRDGFVPEAAGVAPQNVRVLIIGGGIAGLTAAWRLRALGVDDLAVVELGKALGGTSAGGRSAVTGYPWGAHYVPAPWDDNPELQALFREMDVLAGRTEGGQPRYRETHLASAPTERLFVRGLWHAGLFPKSVASPADLKELARFQAEVGRWIGYRDADGRRAFTLPIARCGEDADLRRLDQMTMAQWLEQSGFASPMLRWYVDYACRDDFGADASEVSAWYGLHYFASRTPAPGWSSAEFLTWPQGNAFVVDHLADRIGRDRIHTNTMVASIAPEGDGRRAKVIGWQRSAKVARAWMAERVIFALPSFVRHRLIRGFPVTPVPVSYAPWMVANIHLSGRPGYHGFDEAWDNVIYGSRSLGYVVATHRDGPAHGPTVWTYYLPLAGVAPREARERLVGLSHRQACDPVMLELSRCHLGLERHVRRIDVMRWGHGMARPEPGTAFSSARRGAARSIGPIHFAHTDLSGVALFEEAFYHGRRSAEEVHAALGKTG